MKAADQSILQLLGPPKTLELTPSNVARNVGLSRGYTSERLGVLVDHELLERDTGEGSHPYYSITEKGEALLKGEIDIEEIDAKELEHE